MNKAISLDYFMSSDYAVARNRHREWKRLTSYHSQSPLVSINLTIKHACEGGSEHQTCNLKKHYDHVYYPANDNCMEVI